MSNPYGGQQPIPESGSLGPLRDHLRAQRGEQPAGPPPGYQQQPPQGYQQQGWPGQPSQYGPPPQQGYYGPPGRPPRRRRRTGLWVTLSIIGAVVVIIIAAAAAAGGKGSSGGGVTATSGTVTYIVTGAKADIQYGPAGTELSGHVPMKVTKPLGDPDYYSISAQLQGGGSVSCKLEVNGKVIATGQASGGYNIASCEMDHFGGVWQDSNASG